MLKLFLVAVVLGQAVVWGAAGGEGSDVCALIKADLPEGKKMGFLLGKVGACAKGVLAEEQRSTMSELSSIDSFRQLFKDFCPHVQDMTTCLADLRSSIATCESTDIAVMFRILLEWMEHMLVSGCENDGDRLAHVMKGMFIIKKDVEHHVPFRRCFYKKLGFMKLANDADMDILSESYIMHSEMSRLKKCTDLIEDEDYRTVYQWMLDETISSFKCKHPEESTIIPCSEVDASKVTVTNVCKITDTSADKLYGELQRDATIGCYQSAFNHDKLPVDNYVNDLNNLEVYYKSMCKSHVEVPYCLLHVSLRGDECLSEEDNKHFQLQIQATEDAMSRMCVEKGARLAAVMYEVYNNTAEHGNAVRDCYKSVNEASKNHQVQATSNKSIRFFHNLSSLKQCVVEKLHATNDLAINVESAFDDVLKKMKCVNPEDGSIVLCETVHQH